MRAIVVAAVLALGVCAPAEGSTAPVPCRANPTWLCGSVTVPIDRSGTVPDTIDVQYTVQGTDPPPVLLILQGGPGMAGFGPLVTPDDGFGAFTGRYRIAA